MDKYIILTIVLAALILGAFLYSGGYLPGVDSPGASGNSDIRRK